MADDREAKEARAAVHAKHGLDLIVTRCEKEL
jgi:hypothetical protein